MNAIKESRSDIAVSEREMETKVVDHTSIISGTDCNTQSNIRKGIIANMLHIGEKNAIKGEELQTLAGMKGIRELRNAVERERLCGGLILTSNRGYFLAETDMQGNLTARGYSEAKRFYSMMRAKAIGTFKSAKSARLAIDEYERVHGAGTDGRE